MIECKFYNIKQKKERNNNNKKKNKNKNIPENTLHSKNITKS